jgi:hypothetical protein
MRKPLDLKYGKLIPTYNSNLASFIERLRITRPWSKIVFCATRDAESRENCCSSPIELSLMCNFVWGNAGRRQLTAVAFEGERDCRGVTFLND